MLHAGLIALATSSSFLVCTFSKFYTLVIFSAKDLPQSKAFIFSFLVFPQGKSMDKIHRSTCA